MEEKGIKIILLGDSGVGKTNLINVLFDNNFEVNNNSTHNCYYFEGEINYNNKNYMYNVWDTAGQEQYRSLNRLFVKYAKIVICVYAIDFKESFKSMEFWINYVKETLGEGNYILGLIGNKSDLFEKQEVLDEEGEEFAKKNNMKFKITSALTDSKGFKNYVNELINEYLELYGENEDNTKNDSFKVHKMKTKKVTKTNCCE